MAANFGPIGSEIQVILSPDQDCGQSNPNVVALMDDRFLIVLDAEVADQNIVGQFINADGTVFANRSTGGGRSAPGTGWAFRPGGVPGADDSIAR